VLKHLGILLPRPAARGIFDDEYRQFFVRYNEPPHVKHLKVGLIPFISNSSNANDIAAELSEYVTDVDSELSIKAINALGSIAMRVQSASASMTSRLVELIDLDIPYVRSEAIKNLSNIVRIFPDMKSLVVPSLSRCLRRVDDAEAKSAVVWMIGEFGQEILEAPYMLEPIIDRYPKFVSLIHTMHAIMVFLL
jgi:AP-4 complex subunit beta-1